MDGAFYGGVQLVFFCILRNKKRKKNRVFVSNNLFNEKISMVAYICAAD